ncbi:hypothetical protein JCM17960_09270 [Magnetospira thiophila]
MAVQHAVQKMPGPRIAWTQAKCLGETGRGIVPPFLTLSYQPKVFVGIMPLRGHGDCGKTIGFGFVKSAHLYERICEIIVAKISEFFPDGGLLKNFGIVVYGSHPIFPALALDAN